MAGLNDLRLFNALNIIEEAEILAQRPYRRYDFMDPLEECPDQQFIKLYRLPKNVARELIVIMEPHMTPPTRISALSIPRKVLCALRFFASGSYQWDIARNVNHGISQTSTSKAINEVVGVLNQPDIMNRFVHLPRNFEELNELRRRFYEKNRFPGVIGCVDCTHVAIFPPHLEEEIYVNRKGYHSINVQLICDQDLKIINVCARFPGSSHDSFIWNNSEALPYIRNIHNNGHTSFSFLGDSGYALRPWMLTPVANAQPGSPEELYNQRQCNTRSTVERCIGVLKLRFRCLLKHRVLHYKPQTAAKIINSCVVLHNICINNNVPPIELGYDPDEHVPIDYGMYPEDELERGMNQVVNNPELAAGRRMRQFIIRNYFNRV